MSIAPPESSQLVEVRRRQWVVAEVQASTPGGADVSHPQHFVTLTSLDEDALNESLAVVWELEPGARVLETAGLPTIDGWDSCERLEAFLDAVRWGAATNADRSLLQATTRTCQSSGAGYKRPPGVECPPQPIDDLGKIMDRSCGIRWHSQVVGRVRNVIPNAPIHLLGSPIALAVEQALLPRPLQEVGERRPELQRLPSRAEL